MQKKKKKRKKEEKKKKKEEANRDGEALGRVVCGTLVVGQPQGQVIVKSLQLHELRELLCLFSGLVLVEGGDLGLDTLQGVVKSVVINDLHFGLQPAGKGLGPLVILGLQPVMEDGQANKLAHTPGTGVLQLQEGNTVEPIREVHNHAKVIQLGNIVRLNILLDSSVVFSDIKSQNEVEHLLLLDQVLEWNLARALLVQKSTKGQTILKALAQILFVNLEVVAWVQGKKEGKKVRK